MLILSRNSQQKIVFPNLGIVIQVVDIKGKYVRLGINAPKEIRILREELAHGSAAGFCDSYGRSKRLDGKGFGNVTAQPGDGADSDRIEIMVRQLDTANLAIHLAQNQLRQGRFDYAETSLQHAIDCLNEIEVSAGLISYEELYAVREPSARYKVNRKTEALVLGGSQNERQLAIDFLRNAGIDVRQQDTWTSLQLLDAMQSDDSSPDLVLLLEPRILINDIRSPLLLKLGTLGGLTRRAKVEMAGQVATLWMLDTTTIPEHFEMVN